MSHPLKTCCYRYPPGSYYLDTTGFDPHGQKRGPGQAKNCSLDPAVADRVDCPPDSDPEVCEGCSHSTGEACGQVFWVKLMQRLHQLRPLNESYVGEIERVLINGVVSQIPPVNGSGKPGQLLCDLDLP